MYPCIDIVNEGRILKFHSILYFRDVCGYSLSSNNLPHKTIIMIESVKSTFDFDFTRTSQINGSKYYCDDH